MLAGIVSINSMGPSKGSSPSSATRGRVIGQESGSKAGGRVFEMTLKDSHATPEVVKGKLSIANKDLHVLIYSGSTHSWSHYLLFCILVDMFIFKFFFIYLYPNGKCNSG